MDPVEMDRTCPKCGERMLLMPDTAATNWGVRVCECMCPNCLHVERVKVIVAKRVGP